MHIRNILACVPIVALSVLPAGCGAPTTFDPTLMHQYQRHVVASGPQQRAADSLVKPVPGTTGPPLETATDPDTGRTQILLTIDEVVQRALSNNNTIKTVGYDPAIAREDIRIAEAEFDTIVSSSVGLAITDGRTPVGFRDELDPVTGETITVPTEQTQRTRQYSFQAASTKRLATGGQVQVSFTGERLRTKSRPMPEGIFDPAYTMRLGVQLTQPLLRDAGPYVTRSQIRVARLNHDISMDAFRATVLQVVSEAQSLYWQLKSAREHLDIALQLLQRSETTLEYVRARSNLDASRVQITDAEGSVATNRLNVIEARKTIRDIQDRLVRIMADASITLLDDYDIVPVTPFSTKRFVVDPADQIATALKYNPNLAQARTSIAVQDVSVRVARNQALPRLDLSAGASPNSVHGSFSDTWRQLWNMDYVDYNIALAFEQPIGNRAARANLRRARYGRAQSIATMQDTADQVALAVNDSIRSIFSGYEQMQAAEAALKANLAHLDALEVRRDFTQALTPDFLNRLLAAQENVARAEQTLLSAKVRYNASQAALAQVTGTALQDMGVLITDVDEDIVRLLVSRADLTGRHDDTEDPAGEDGRR